MKDTVVIGSRGSRLALWQAHYTRDKLVDAGYKIEIRVIKTKGDAIQHLSFDKIEGKGFFTKEIEDALLAGDIDMAVHSCKDLPTESPQGLTIGAYSKREAANDVLLINKNCIDDTQIFHLNSGSTVGTSSARRKAQLLSFRDDLHIKDIRGNVPTRVNKLREGHFDAIVLAAAGLDRLELDVSDVLRLNLPTGMFIPAPAQGILAYQVRQGDEDMNAILEVLNDEKAGKIANIEREVLASFEGGCQVPLGIYAREGDGGMHVWVSKSENWDSMPKRMHFRLNGSLGVGDAILSAFNAAVSGSVFISTELENDDLFKGTLRLMV